MKKIKNHSCPQCDYKCYQLGSLKSHISNNHRLVKSEKCGCKPCKKHGGAKNRDWKGSQRASPKATTTSKCCVRITASEREIAEAKRRAK